MDKNIPMILFAVFAAVLFSCTEEIHVSTDGSQPLAVHLILEMDSVQTMSLCHVRKLYSSANEPVTDAEVYLQKREDRTGDLVTVAEFHPTDSIFWEASYRPDYGAGYRLLIQRKGLKDVTADTRYPDDLRLKLMGKPRGDADILEPPGLEMRTARQYAYTATVMEAEHTPLRLLFNTPEIVMNGWNSITGQILTPYLDTTSMVSKVYPDKTIKTYCRPYQGAVKIWIFPHKEVTDVTETYSDLLLHEDKLLYRGSDKPYAKFAVTDHPNADAFNTAPGKVSHIPWATRLVPESQDGIKSHYFGNISEWIPDECPTLSLHKGFLRIDHPAKFHNNTTDNGLAGSYHSSSSSFLVFADYDDSYPTVESYDKEIVEDIPEYGDIFKEYNSKFIFPRYYKVNASFINEVRFLSDEYDAYLRDVYVHKGDQDNFILSNYDYDNIYSNVNGGIGIFGAELATWDELDLHTYGIWQYLLSPVLIAI